MISLSLGSHGDEVRRVEQRLKDVGLYTGAIDGAFGGGVQSAVKAFQKSRDLPPDGIIGPRTWALLLPGDEPPAAPSLASQPLAQRCLALTGTFETSTGSPDCYCGVAGNFDKQGISFGVLQWNFGQGTLQPLLSEMIAAHRDVAETIFQDDLRRSSVASGSTRPQQLQLGAVDPGSAPLHHLRTVERLFKALGRTPEFQAIQVEHADRIRQTAVAMCQEFGVTPNGRWR